MIQAVTFIGMVSSRDPFKGVKLRDLQRSGMKRARIESPGSTPWASKRFSWRENRWEFSKSPQKTKKNPGIGIFFITTWKDRHEGAVKKKVCTCICQGLPLRIRDYPEISGGWDWIT